VSYCNFRTNVVQVEQHTKCKGRCLDCRFAMKIVVWMIVGLDEMSSRIQVSELWV